MVFSPSSQPKNHRAPRAGRKDAGREVALSIVAADLRIEGELSATGIIRIEGTVVGDVRAGRQVLVAKGGIVEGDIRAPEAVLGGEVRGLTLADERAELQATAVVLGDIATPRLVVHEGAALCGQVRMRKPEMASQPATPEPAKVLQIAAAEPSPGSGGSFREPHAAALPTDRPA